MDSNQPDEWFADESFWETSYPFMFPPQAFEAAIVDAPQIVELTGCRSGALLDLCCGPARHSIQFAKMGFAVTGVDRSAFLLEKARALGQSEDVSIEWVEEDMRRFRREESFDLAINLFTAFGYFRDPRENQLVLENIHASLRSGGALLLDVNGKERIARIFEPTGSTELPGYGLNVQRRRFVEDMSIMDNDWIFITDDKVSSFRIRHWVYSGAELKAMLADAGFVNIRLYGSFAGDPYDLNARRLIAVAYKQ